MHGILEPMLLQPMYGHQRKGVVASSHVNQPLVLVNSFKALGGDIFALQNDG